MKGMKISFHWRPALLGLGIGIVTMVSTCAGAAGLMARGIAAPEHMGLFASGILVLSALVGAMTSLLAGGGSVDAIGTTLGEFVVLLGLNGALCGARVEGIGATMLALAGGCGAAELLRLGKGSGSRRHRRRR